MSSFLPQIGQWYQDRDSGQLFEIVAIDSDEAVLQLQYLDGEISDCDLDSWAELALASAAAPEDWRSAFEIDGDLDTEGTLHPIQWGNPVLNIEPDTILGVDEF
jgi:hypothetical protein